MFISTGTLVILAILFMNPTQGEAEDFFSSVFGFIKFLFYLTIFLAVGGLLVWGGYLLYTLTTTRVVILSMSLVGIFFWIAIYSKLLHEKHKGILTDEDKKEYGGNLKTTLACLVGGFIFMSWCIYSEVNISKGDHISKVYRILGKPTGVYKDKGTNLSWFYDKNNTHINVRTFIFNNKNRVIYDKILGDLRKDFERIEKIEKYKENLYEVKLTRR